MCRIARIMCRPSFQLERLSLKSYTIMPQLRYIAANMYIRNKMSYTAIGAGFICILSSCVYGSHGVLD